jgi:hypothetical protein
LLHTVLQGADDKLGQFLVKVFRQRLIIVIFGGSHLKAEHLWYTSNIKQTNCCIFKNMLAEYASLAALLEPLRTGRKPPNLNQKNFFSDENNF